MILDEISKNANLNENASIAEYASWNLCKLGKLVTVYDKDSKQIFLGMNATRNRTIKTKELGVAQKEYGGASLSQLGVEKNLEFRKYHEDDKKEIARHANLE